MAIELITGRSGTPHVHSIDVRQFNRGIFGQEKYRLYDRKNCAVTVAPGNIQIDDGGIIWNGMHIRHWKASYSYASPASTQTVGVYLHYTRDENSIEKVEFETFVGANAPTTKDNFSDLDVEAYTLFYSFTHNSNGSISNGAYHFLIVKPNKNLESEIDTKISKIIERKELATNVKAGSTVTLKENINNFVYFEILVEGSYARYPVADFDSTMRGSKAETRICIPTGGANADGSVPWASFRNIHIKLNGQSLKYVRGNTFSLNSSGAVAVYNNPTIAKIYGVQRK